MSINTIRDIVYVVKMMTIGNYYLTLIVNFLNCMHFLLTRKET